jgi:hypothetical protein
MHIPQFNEMFLPRLRGFADVRERTLAAWHAEARSSPQDIRWLPEQSVVVHSNRPQTASS